MLPGARALLCNTLQAPGTPGELFALDLESKELKPLGIAGTDPRYLPTGQLMFAQGNQVLVVDFDLEALAPRGTPAPVLSRVWIDSGQIQADVANDGTVVYLPRGPGETQSLVSVDRNGKVEPLVPDGLPFSSLNDPRLSPDGDRLVLSADTGAIWMVDLSTQTPTLLSESGFYPVWSPAGGEIVFSTSRGKTFDVMRVPIDLSRPEELLLDQENNLRTMDWTRKGELVIREEIPGKGMDLRYWPDLTDESSIRVLMDGPDDELAPVVSPDDRWMAYVSDYSGSDEIYVTSFPETGARSKVSIKGGNSPTWSPDGKELYYFEGRRFVAVSVETTPAFRVLGRRTLLEGEFVQYRWSRQYDVAPDGNRFVMIKNPARRDVEVITNWFAELRKLVD